VRGLLARRPFRFLGRVSYSLYLVHFPVALALASLAVALPPALRDDPWLPFAVFALAIPLAALGYRFVERPAIEAGNRLCALLARRTGQRTVASRLNVARAEE
jgi:peptidoglycan/LPS O-acetylase OafA/YrhL